jgi:hypothetical protein
MATVAVQLVFFYLLRQSEYIYTKPSAKRPRADHALRAEDITFEVDIPNAGRVWYESWQVTRQM